MRAMVLEEVGKPLVLKEVPVPDPRADEVRIRVEACAVCRTDLHIIDGELKEGTFPLILGHQVVGIVHAVGPEAEGLEEGDRVGVPWVGGTCGQCEFCEGERENLCDAIELTGYQRDGGYAEYMCARADYCLRLDAEMDAAALTPLMCAGMLGYRSYRMATEGGAQKIGFYGFGNAAQILIQIARCDGRKVYAFTRPGDEANQELARDMDAAWACGSDEEFEEELDAAIIFAPVGDLVPVALKAVKKGGVVVCAGIHMSDIPAMPYALLWGERTVRSVANLTRKDGPVFFEQVLRCGLEVEYTPFPLEEANAAIEAMREGSIAGSAVLVI